MACSEQEPKCLDLAFAMDCTGSMGSYIDNAKKNIHQIVESIVSEEKAAVRLALVEYRDHPPQDKSFVTRVHDFTSSVNQMRQWLDQCKARGGGDRPEAVADALFEVYKLDWKPEATKLCLLISDAPPHGLDSFTDGFPNGCPVGIDPMEATGKLAEKGISLYVVGCEPSIIPYKDFFMSLAYLTGGIYVPLSSARLLAKVIIGGVQEELSLQQLMEQVSLDTREEFNSKDGEDICEEELITRVKEKLKTRGVRTKRLQMNKAELPQPTINAKKMAKCLSMQQVREIHKMIEPTRAISEVVLCKGKPIPCMPKSRHVESHMVRHPEVPPDVMFPGLKARNSPAQPMRQLAACDHSCRGTHPDEPSDVDYLCVEEEVSSHQVQRLVQKSIMTNKLHHRNQKE